MPLENKRRYFIWLLTLSLICGALLPQRMAFAVFSQPDADVLQTNFHSGIRETLGQPAENFVIGSGNFKLKFKTQQNSGVENPVLGFWKDGNFIGAFSTNCGNVGTDVFDGIWTFPDSCYSDVLAIYLKDFEFETGHSYKIEVGMSNGKAAFYGSTANVNSNDWLEYCEYDCTPLTLYYSDIYFAIGSYQDIIEFVFPVNATSTPDFESWHLNFAVSSTPPTAGKVRVNYGKDPNNYWNEYHDEINFIVYDNAIGEVAISKGNLLSAGSWFAGGDLIVGTSTIKSTSPDIAFTIWGGGGYLENFYYEVPTSTWATSTLPIQITCDPTDDLFQYSLCKLAAWLFVPKSTTLNKFSGLIEGIQNKPPIGYFYVIKSALEGFQSTSTKAFELNATSTGALATPVFTPLKTGLGFGLWLTFGFWLFGRIRHLEL